MAENSDGSVSFERFETCVGSDFVGVEGSGTTRFALVEAQPLREAGVRGTGAPFSLLFSASDGAATEQGTYRLRHPDLGDVDIFLVPVAQGETGLLFEAVFN
jgi:hypothetical protein